MIGDFGSKIVLKKDINQNSWNKSYINTCCSERQDKNKNVVKGVLHLLPKISMFCDLSQNNQQLFEVMNFEIEHKTC